MVGSDHNTRIQGFRPDDHDGDQCNKRNSDPNSWEVRRPNHSDHEENDEDDEPDQRWGTSDALTPVGRNDARRRPNYEYGFTIAPQGERMLLRLCRMVAG